MMTSPPSLSLSSPLNARPFGRFWFLISAASLVACWATGCASNRLVPVDVKCRNIEEPKLVIRVEPSYPEVARREGLEGKVVVKAIIGTDGTVSDIEVLSSPAEILKAATVRAVSQWRYRPAFCKDLGKTIRVYLDVTVTYNLGGRKR